MKNETRRVLDENVNRHVTLFKNPLVRVVNIIITTTILFFGAAFSKRCFGAAFSKRCFGAAFHSSFLAPCSFLVQLFLKGALDENVNRVISSRFSLFVFGALVDKVPMSSM